MLIDDSIVEGTTSKEIIQMARDSGAKKFILLLLLLQLDIQMFMELICHLLRELIAHNKNNDQIAKEIGADMVIYQSLLT